MNMDDFEIVVLLAVVFIHGIVIGYIIGATPSEKNESRKK